MFCQKEKEHRVLMLTALVLNLASSHGSRVGKSAHGVLINSHGRSDSLTAVVCEMELLSLSQYQDGAEPERPAGDRVQSREGEGGSASGR